ncbi:EI24 domain-containing protein [Hyalangium rubrum]|uniref:EI24 domain-containing protein n=1 Tax=Hyalangium rubrum TaxID=3103134 RepID=A0ABU5H6P7_9BACT|nr:EI24 domain-containing protein [Hyalangium sp. s54d21]MDY7228432.1 EI24 domain-containing protein [Hyalangium sp. s54d21]
MTPTPIPDFTPRPTAASDFFQGVGLLGRAFGLIFRTPKLFLLSALCAVVTLVSLVVLVVLLWTYTPELISNFFARPESWYGKGLWYLVVFLTFVVGLVVGANALPPLLLAPLQDPISETTEEQCGDFQPLPFTLRSFVRGVLTGIAHTLARIFFMLLGLLVLLPLHFIPGVGSILWTVLGSLWTMLWMAGEHLASPMTRHLYPFAEVRRMMRERRALCLGFGAGVYLLLWVPVLNTFFLPVAIVAGTLLYRGLRAAGHLPPPPSAASRALP